MTLVRTTRTRVRISTDLLGQRHTSARIVGGEQRDALQKALIEAIRTGADTVGLRDAIELLDGTTELSPYRQDTSKVIAEYEASGQTMPGTAARVLDYSALWVHEDGSSRMLEHEIVRIQSREAIQEHAEQRLPRGLVLRLRTVKRDGSVLEPEFVEGKPTVTMPHLEIGDYIETETLVSLRGDGQGGLSFQGPRWFFREEKVPYRRSEFIIVSPKSRPLDVEVGGSVPAPQVTEAGALVTRRYRVDKSPALPEEPASAPASEFLPNVRIGWGISLDDTIARMMDAVADETPRDPRLVRVARTIAATAPTPEGKGPALGAAAPKPKAPGAGAPSSTFGASATKDEQARRIYRWVLANVEAGRENDGRRVVIGKSGNRTEAFVYLCRLLGIDATYGVVSDRLTAPARGKMSEAETFNALAVRLDTSEKGGAPQVRWMIVREKFAAYGYLPSSLRGQPAIVLRPGTPREVTPVAGATDGVLTEGVAEVDETGAAKLSFEQHYDGKLAIALRTALETLPDAQLRDTIESRLLAQMLPGARLSDIEILNLTELDAPLTLKMEVSVVNFGRAQGGELVISPPFVVRVGNLAGLPVRETPLYISEQIATRSEVRLRVKLPAGARLSTKLAPITVKDDRRIVTVNDRLEGGALVFERLVDMPAGRVQPDAYPSFQQFARSSDSALDRDVVVHLGGGT
jgi:cellulose synthase operon protein C